MSHLIDGTNDLNDLLSQSSDTVIQDLKGINQQMRVITDLLRQEEKNDEDPVEDISDQIDSQQQRAGCLSGSKNMESLRRRERGRCGGLHGSGI